MALKPGLERIRELLEYMDSPHRAYPSVHVGGTNGKGSTASFIASIASAAGLRTGLHTSPHLRDVGELMRVDGAPAAHSWIAECVRRYRDAFEFVGPSFFEATVALSLFYFAHKGVDLAVIEVGLGGRLDATNVLDPEVAVITNVSLEHQRFLGETVREIAVEKAGIIKEGRPVVTGVDEGVVDVFQAAARRHSAPFHWIGEEMRCSEEVVELTGTSCSIASPVQRYEEVFVGLAGTHQIANAMAAVRAAEIAIPSARSDPRAVGVGLREVRRRAGLRGRMEILSDSPLVVSDVAHNPAGLAAVLDHLRACGRIQPGVGRLTVLFATLRDKDVAAQGRLLRDAHAIVHPVPLDATRAMPVGELAKALEVVGVDVEVPATVQNGLHAFLSEATNADTLLITGSHLVVALADSAIA